MPSTNVAPVFAIVSMITTGSAGTKSTYDALASNVVGGSVLGKSSDWEKSPRSDGWRMRRPIPGC